jgi:hypothetical protein
LPYHRLMAIAHTRDRTISTLYRFYLGALALIVIVAVGALVFRHSSSGGTNAARQAAGSATQAKPATHSKPAAKPTTHAKSATHAASPIAVNPAAAAAPAVAAAQAAAATPVAATPVAATPAAGAATPAAATPAPATAAASTPVSDSSTTFTPVAAASGSGCTAGITDGAQWIKYTVRPGDTLSMIASCFQLNGYETLYQQNIAVLGPNPNLIYPGEVITIVNGVMVVTPPT